MEYQLTRADLDTITEPEVMFGTVKLLPDYDLVPQAFKDGNVYTRIVDCMFYGRPMPEAEVIFKPGFDDDESSAQMLRALRAHLCSFQPKHEHKIAGLGFLIAQICDITDRSLEPDPA